MASPQKADGRLATVMQEDRVFPPPAAFSAKARIGSLEDYRRLYEEAKADPDGFWDARAKALPWMTPYSQVLDWQPPFARWFVGGRTNASAACVDQQVALGRGDKTAIVWVEATAGFSRRPAPSRRGRHEDLS